MKYRASRPRAIPHSAPGKHPGRKDRVNDPSIIPNRVSEKTQFGSSRGCLPGVGGGASKGAAFQQWACQMTRARCA